MILRNASREFRSAVILRFLSSFVAGWFWIFGPIYFLSLGHSIAETGAVMAAYSLSALAALGVFGFLADFKSPKKLALAGTALLSLFYVLLSMQKTFSGLLLAAAFGGIAVGLNESAARSISYKKVSESQRGKDVGTIEFFRNLGIGLAIISAGTLFSTVGFANGFLAFAVFCGIAFIYALTVPDEKTTILDKTYLAVFRKTEYVSILVVMLLLSYHFGAENAVLGAYAKQVIGLDEGGVGRLFALSITCYAAFNYFAGKRFDSEKNLRKLFLVGLLFSALGFAAFGFTRDFATAFLVRIFHELGDAIVIAYSFFSLSRLGGARRVGGLQGVMVMLTTAGSAIGAFGSGLIASTLGFQAAFVTAALLAILGGVALFFLNAGRLFHSEKLVEK